MHPLNNSPINNYPARANKKKVVSNKESYENITPSHRGILLDTKNIETEMRRDYLHDNLVIIAPNRGSRPYDTKDFGHTLIETAQSPKLDKNPLVWQSLNRHGNWKVKVVENKYPSLTLDNPQAYGKQEVVIDTPKANTSFSSLSALEIEEVFKAYLERTKKLQAQNGIEYVLIFKNDGYESGASLAHAHSQIFALPVVPLRYQHEAELAEAYKKETNHNPYDDIIGFEKKSNSRIIFENNHWFVFCPFASQWPFEVWLLPKRHIRMSTELNQAELKCLPRLIKQYCSKLNRHKISFNMYLQNGVSKNHRFCIKICGRSNIWGGFEVSTGIIINTVPPESAAKWYKS